MRIFGILKEFLFKGYEIFRDYGFIYSVRRGWAFLQRGGLKEVGHSGTPLSLDKQYKKWLAQNDMKRISLLSEEEGSTSLISIVIFIGNPETQLLRQTIQSIMKQTSPWWELFLVFGCPEYHESLDHSIRSIIETDKRISMVSSSKKEGAGYDSVLESINSEFLMFMDQDEILNPETIAAFQKEIIENTNLDLLYADEDLIRNGKRVEPYFKPDWSPHLLEFFNYIGHPLVVHKKIVTQVGGLSGFRSEDEHSLLLRMRRMQICAKRVPMMLSTRRGETRASREHCHQDIRIKLKEKISIIIPTKDNYHVLKRCLDSIKTLSTYDNYEIIIINNGSTNEQTLEYIEEVAKDSDHIVLDYPEPFNYPLINNLGAGAASGSHYLFLNDDTEVLSPGWLESLLKFSQQPDVGAVGALLVFPNGLVQHAGIVVGMRGSASHAFYKLDPSSSGYMGLLYRTRNVSAVTAACMMIKAEAFKKVGGFNPAFKVGLNDVDLCLRLLEIGLYNIYTPYAKLMHYESLTRGQYVDESEILLFKELHKVFLEAGDPYYHPALSLVRNDFSLAV